MFGTEEKIYWMFTFHVRICTEQEFVMDFLDDLLCYKVKVKEEQRLEYCLAHQWFSEEENSM